MKFVVKKFGKDGLHITLPKKYFILGEVVDIEPHKNKPKTKIYVDEEMLKESLSEIEKRLSKLEEIVYAASNNAY